MLCINGESNVDWVGLKSVKNAFLTAVLVSPFKLTDKQGAFVKFPELGHCRSLPGGSWRGLPHWMSCHPRFSGWWCGGWEQTRVRVPQLQWWDIRVEGVRQALGAKGMKGFIDEEDFVKDAGLDSVPEKLDQGGVGGGRLGGWCAART